MMIGLFPPGKNKYTLLEKQKSTAIPPIDGFNFSAWIDELAVEALPNQATIFPIQMNSFDHDHMLALDDLNCPNR